MTVPRNVPLNPAKEASSTSSDSSSGKDNREILQPKMTHELNSEMISKVATSPLSNCPTISSTQLIVDLSIDSDSEEDSRKELNKIMKKKSSVSTNDNVRISSPNVDDNPTIVQKKKSDKVDGVIKTKKKKRESTTEPSNSVTTPTSLPVSVSTTTSAPTSAHNSAPTSAATSATTSTSSTASSTSSATTSGGKLKQKQKSNLTVSSPKKPSTVSKTNSNRILPSPPPLVPLPYSAQLSAPSLALSASSMLFSAPSLLLSALSAPSLPLSAPSMLVSAPSLLLSAPSLTPSASSAVLPISALYAVLPPTTPYPYGAPNPPPGIPKRSHNTAFGTDHGSSANEKNKKKSENYKNKNQNDNNNNNNNNNNHNHNHTQNSNNGNNQHHYNEENYNRNTENNNSNPNLSTISSSGSGSGSRPIVPSLSNFVPNLTSSSQPINPIFNNNIGIGSQHYYISHPYNTSTSSSSSSYNRGYNETFDEAALALGVRDGFSSGLMTNPRITSNFSIQNGSDRVNRNMNDRLLLSNIHRSSAAASVGRVDPRSKDTANYGTNLGRQEINKTQSLLTEIADDFARD